MGGQRVEARGATRTNKTLAQLDPAITISPALLECRCNHQLFAACLRVTIALCGILINALVSALQAAAPLLHRGDAVT